MNKESIEMGGAIPYHIRSVDWPSQRVITFKRDKPKVGRNEPCPCGSGLKYKKCCLGKKE